MVVADAWMSLATTRWHAPAQVSLPVGQGDSNGPGSEWRAQLSGQKAS